MVASLQAIADPPKGPSNAVRLRPKDIKTNVEIQDSIIGSQTAAEQAKMLQEVEKVDAAGQEADATSEKIQGTVPGFNAAVTALHTGDASNLQNRQAVQSLSQQLGAQKVELQKHLKKGNMKEEDQKSLLGNLSLRLVSFGSGDSSSQAPSNDITPPPQGFFTI